MDARPYYPEPYRNRLGGGNRLGRLLWAFTRGLLFRPTPARCFGWRAWLLRRFGADIGEGAHIYPTARVWAPWNLAMGPRSCIADRVDCYNVARVELGADAVVSQDAFLCTASHDIDDPERPLVTRPIEIGAGAWVFARAMIAPGVRIGRGAVVALGAVVVKDVPAQQVVGGNPARVLRQRRYGGAGDSTAV